MRISILEEFMLNFQEKTMVKRFVAFSVLLVWSNQLFPKTPACWYLSGITGSNLDNPAALSSDGLIVVGGTSYGYGGNAEIWRNGFLTQLSIYGRFTGISGDGTVLVGLNGSDGFKYENNQVISIGFIPWAISKDGKTIVGESGNHAFICKNGENIDIGGLPNYYRSFAKNLYENH